MSMPFDELTQAVSARMGGLTSSTPFQRNPLLSSSPFGQSLSGDSPFRGGVMQSGTPFDRVPFSGQSPFSGGAFGSGSVFGGNPFRSGSPFGAGSPFASGFNPYKMQSDGEATDAPQYDIGNLDTSGMKVDTGSAAAWLQKTRPGNPLVPYADFLVSYANSKNVSPALIMALMLKETQLGSDNSPGARTNNWGNVGPGNSYATPQDGIRAMVDAIASYGTNDIPTIIGYYYAGPERWKKYGLQATDMGDGSAPSPNGNVQDYLNTFIYPTMLQFGAKRSISGGASGSGAWQQRANQALGYGTAYTNAGIRNDGNPQSGFDCSSFTGYALGLPQNLWNAQAQYNAARKISQQELKPGDLVFFDIANPGDATARPVGHVAIYIGNGKIMHSTTTTGKSGVQVSSLSGYYAQHVYGYGRF